MIGYIIAMKLLLLAISKHLMTLFLILLECGLISIILTKPLLKWFNLTACKQGGLLNHSKKYGFTKTQKRFWIINPQNIKSSDL